jgi:hypothetical protein
MAAKNLIYKVSYVVADGSLPGAIKNQTERPEVGHHIKIGKYECEVIEIEEVMPPSGNFLYLHATVEPVTETPKSQ